MSSITTTAAAPSSSHTCGTPAQYEIPIKDAACAVPNNDKYPKIMEKCCHDAPVSAYDGDCAIYCLAMGQSVKALTDCLYDAKVDWGDVWCSGNTSATATETSVKATATATKSKSDKETGSATATKSGASASGTSENAAVTLSGAPSKMSVLVIGSLVLTSMVGLFA
ncbi:hypothetical protein BDV23DRAFT_88970 [Aspergillus alliaceus]|uniref:Uncharacterized protein n=1 Tax=Petromyces alliaceus TaxID=209559 RepID=A0A5N7C8Z6_PETAA|nr:hypothetical protein BDV23DRAFT_88970 [Aspergillus alliaceus]